jgi:hypothetical protein
MQEQDPIKSRDVDSSYKDWAQQLQVGNRCAASNNALVGKEWNKAMATFKIFVLKSRYLASLYKYDLAANVAAYRKLADGIAEGLLFSMMHRFPTERSMVSDALVKMSEENGIDVIDGSAGTTGGYVPDPTPPDQTESLWPQK